MYNVSGINIKPWPIKSLYQPDAIRHFEHGEQSYLVTANEGDPKSYTLTQHGINWTEQIRGNELVSGWIVSKEHIYIYYISIDTNLAYLTYQNLY